VFEEKTIRRIFNISLVIKGLISFVELIGGVIVLFISQRYVISFVYLVTQGELAEDPKDFIANYLMTSAQNFSVISQHFLALYLLIHGLIKSLLVFGLLKQKLWMYPLAFIAFSLFGLYQVFGFLSTYSIWLLVLTVLDAIIIFLMYHEFEYVKSMALK
jgi:uncharacterized membrane protein